MMGETTSRQLQLTLDGGAGNDHIEGRDNFKITKTEKRLAGSGNDTFIGGLSRLISMREMEMTLSLSVLDGRSIRSSATFWRRRE